METGRKVESKMMMGRIDFPGGAAENSLRMEDIFVTFINSLCLTLLVADGNLEKIIRIDNFQK
jgi:hypothetical protein